MFLQLNKIYVFKVNCLSLKKNFFKIDNLILDPDPDPDPNWAEIPDPNSMYLDPQHWLNVFCTYILKLYIITQEHSADTCRSIKKIHTIAIPNFLKVHFQICLNSMVWSSKNILNWIRNKSFRICITGLNFVYFSQKQLNLIYQLISL